MKRPTVADTLNHIQKNLIPYGPDKRARFVEDVCSTLEESRMGYCSEDRERLAEHDAADAFSFIDLFDHLAKFPVAIWNGEKMIGQTSGKAIHLVLTNPERPITIVPPKLSEPRGPT